MLKTITRATLQGEHHLRVFGEENPPGSLPHGQAVSPPHGHRLGMPHGAFSWPTGPQRDQIVS